MSAITIIPPKATHEALGSNEMFRPLNSSFEWSREIKETLQKIQTFSFEKKENLPDLNQEQIPSHKLLARMNEKLAELKKTQESTNVSSSSINLTIIKEHQRLSKSIDLLKGKINWLEKKMDCSQHHCLNPQRIIRYND